jgi:serine/threonine protein kinase
MSSIQIGKYHVLKTLGQGAHSKILHVRRSADARQYALKVVPIDDKEDLKYLEQARHEFKVAQMLDHPNLIKVHAVETETDWLFRVRKVLLLLDYINGTTLDKAPKLSLPQMVQVFVKVASGLVHMHKRGVFHADLKPNNIMLGRGGVVKVIDYGLAWIKGHPKARIQGTPEYIAPETAKQKKVNERSDIYNFGATMYRMVTGQLPPAMIVEDGEMPMDAETFLRLLKPVKELNPAAPSVLCDIIQRCLSYDPERRPERVSEIQGTLDHLAEKMIRSHDDLLESLDWGD